ncbi:MAG: hypothetical protein Q4B88_05510 [Moraxella sp.]|nr:hypothetical protein [Moraxella sp.]
MSTYYGELTTALIRNAANSIENSTYDVRHLESDDPDLSLGNIVAVLEDGSIIGKKETNPFSTPPENQRRSYYIWSISNTTGRYTPQKFDAVNKLQIQSLISSRDGKVFAGKIHYGDSEYTQPTIFLNDFKDSIRLAATTGPDKTQPDLNGRAQIIALSHDGKVVAGRAVDHENPGFSNKPVIWSGNNYSQMTILGDNKTYVRSLSADGSVAGGITHKLFPGERWSSELPVIWLGDNYSKRIDLPTSWEGRPIRRLNPEGAVNAISANGKVAGGWIKTEFAGGAFNTEAAVWSGEDYQTVTVLESSKIDGGKSRVHVLNHDGTIAGGSVATGGMYKAPVLWRISYPDPVPATPPTGTVSPSTPVTPPPTDTTPVTPPSTVPVTPPTSPVDTTPVTPPSTPPATPVVVAKIDVANTVQTISNLGADSFSLMAMQSHALDRLQYSCRATQGFCFGTQQDFNVSRDNDNHKIRDIAVGVNAGYGFHNGVSVGVSLDHSASRRLPDSYRHDGDDIGVGAVLRYQSPNGYFGELSGAYDDYTATISRPLLANTELGVNEANIQGISYGIKVGKEFGDVNRYRAYIGAKQRDISRDAYTENDHTAFPISYGKMTHKDTTATLGLSSHIGMTPKLS